MGILHIQKNLPDQTRGQISFATGEITLEALGNVSFFHLLQSRWECVPVRKFGNVQDVRVMGAFLASNHTLHLKVIHI